MTPDQKRLADRVIKLLALASSSTFAAEAQTARSMAEELMRTHNINLGPGKPTQDTIEWREYTAFAKGMRWEGIIAGSLVDLCFCMMFFNSKKLDHYVLVGSIGNLDVLDYMLREVNRQRIVAWLKYKGENGPDSFNQFCYGFAKALEDKIDALNGGAKLEEMQAKLTLWYETNVLGHKCSTTSLSMGAASSDAGLAAGKDACLHRGALGQPQKRIGHSR
jgi:hypothetical protein